MGTGVDSAVESFRPELGHRKSVSTADGERSSLRRSSQSRVLDWTTADRTWAHARTDQRARGQNTGPLRLDPISPKHPLSGRRHVHACADVYATRCREEVCRVNGLA